MAKDYQPVDLSKLRTYSIGRRAHKFDAAAAARLPEKGTGFRDWWESLPGYLGADSLRKLVAAILDARRADRPVVFALGAHVIKVGCGPVVVDLIDRGLVTAVAMNGATAIHDVEVAAFGQTSEEVAETIRDGSFGMVQETPAFFAEACARSGAGLGLGAALGEHLERTSPPNARLSILAAARRAGIPCTVHVALGTDTIHMHDNVAASDLAARSSLDFRLICGVVADLGPTSLNTSPQTSFNASPLTKGGPGGVNPDDAQSAAGVWVNVGSAVLLPEVFLKAVAVARNLGANLDAITTADLDMIRHYRPGQNVTGRPVQAGRGLRITGHHEILLPLLRQALVEGA